jgi:hypothetical protein
VFQENALIEETGSGQCTPLDLPGRMMVVAGGAAFQVDIGQRFEVNEKLLRRVQIVEVLLVGGLNFSGRSLVEIEFVYRDSLVSVIGFEIANLQHVFQSKPDFFQFSLKTTCFALKFCFGGQKDYGSFQQVNNRATNGPLAVEEIQVGNRVAQHLTNCLKL